MRFFHLIRHGQAGLRSNYDTLSEVGARQARLLGDHLRTLPVDCVLTGGLRRQQQTALEAGFTAFDVDPGWSEFDLDAVYREIAPRMAGEDAGFRAEYEALCHAVRDNDHPVHRKWTRGDVNVVRAWVEGRWPVHQTETFAEFSGRVQAAFARLRERDTSVAVFTSATPIGVTVAQAMGAGTGQAMRLAGALVNASVTTLRAGSEPSLYSFNVAAHIAPELHTFR